ncbi:MAG TPA: hypothetical protein ENK75_03095, partial [Saprospiraceae bacterium]|nr:hypothetical protein [Saprospiraceae bacterium]
MHYFCEDKLCFYIYMEDGFFNLTKIRMIMMNGWCGLQKNILMWWVAIFFATKLFSSPIRIMPLGDSITFESPGGNDTRTDGERTGYRSHLWYTLTDRGYLVDFVGSQIAGQDIVPYFDPDNEGWPGEDTQYIADNVFNFLTNNPADMILLHIGTNDVNRGSGQGYDNITSANNVATILDEIDRYETNSSTHIKVVLARIINMKISDSTATERNSITDFNDRVENIVNDRIANGDDIVLVDMENGAGFVYDDSDMYDKLHPTIDIGYAKMAKLWYSNIARYLPNEALHYWPLDEASGPVFEDFAGDSNASCSGYRCPVAGSGIVDGDQFFDGVNDGMDVVSATGFDWTAESNM